MSVQLRGDLPVDNFLYVFCPHCGDAAYRYLPKQPPGDIEVIRLHHFDVINSGDDPIDKKVGPVCIECGPFEVKYTDIQ